MNKSLSGFDYALLDDETRSMVQNRTIEIKTLVHRCAQDIVEIGQKLLDVKEVLEHGQFLKWLKKECPLSVRTAEKFMRTAQVFKFEDFSNLEIGVSALNLLAASTTPASARDEALAIASAGEEINYVLANRIISRHKLDESPPEELALITRNRGNPGKDQDITIDEHEELPNLPESIKTLLTKGRIGVPYALRIASLLKEARPRTQLLSELWGLSDPDLIPELNRIEREGRETFEVLLASGAIPSPTGSILISEARLRDLQDYLNQARFEHMMTGVEVKKDRERRTLRRKLTTLRGDSTEVIVTDNLDDLAQLPDDCVVLFAPGSQSAETLGSLIDKWSLHHMPLLLYKGDPPINLDGVLMPASKARYRIPGLAYKLLEEFCNVSQFKSLSK